MAKLRARVSFFAPTKDGAEVFIGAGQEIDESHEVVKGREGLFEAVKSAPAKKAPARKKA